ncbi:MAG: hypothetical protein QXL94_00175 [Candidatus Parvarchaeum sp.]
MENPYDKEYNELVSEMTVLEKKIDERKNNIDYHISILGKALVWKFIRKNNVLDIFLHLEKRTD